MSFRRLPFQFSTTDPTERQRELERRFGLPSSRNMFVDVANPLSTGNVPRDSSIASSPRLQHRVPIFVEGYDQPIHSSVDSTGMMPETKKPNVRVIPIEVEGRPSPVESRPASTRHRTFSGPAGMPKEKSDGHLPRMNDESPLKRSMGDLSEPTMTKSTTLPRVHTIPIQVEGACNVKSPKVVKSPKKYSHSPKLNGCTVTKSKLKSPEKEHKKKPEAAKSETVEEQPKSGIECSLKKIADVLEELKNYETGVQEFSGTTKDKQYRYLDEMLTRCMLKLDDIDTMGNEEVRSARKNAVRKTQACIDLLESKATSGNEAAATPASENKGKATNEQEPSSQEDVEMTEGQGPGQETNKDAAESHVESTCQNEGEAQKNDVEMAGDAEQNMSQASTQVVTQDESGVQKDVEMTEDQDVTSEVIGEPVEAVENAELSKGTLSETSGEVSEVEMAEVKSSSQDVNSDIPEVEMTDAANKQSLDSDTEMKDVQVTLDNIKETVADKTAASCDSSQVDCKISNEVKSVSDNVSDAPLPSVETSQNNP